MLINYVNLWRAERIQCAKLRGITLNYKASQLVNFDMIKT